MPCCMPNGPGPRNARAATDWDERLFTIQHYNTFYVLQVLSSFSTDSVTDL
jgi:hypothetical protein